MTEALEAVVVGGGLGGLAAAYTLAKGGVQVLVLERGDHPGSKNVTGGRLYLNPVRPFLPDLWEEAPLERPVTREVITAMGNGGSASLSFTSNLFRQIPYHSWTVLRSRFDRWLGDKVGEAGGFVVPQKRVTDLLLEDGRVVGVVADGEEIPARVVIAADGVLSFMAQRAGLREPLSPRYAAVGVKEVIRLGEEEIERRFSLPKGEGSAHLFFGSITKGVFGGGFLYTNRDTVSLGMVVGIEAFRRSPSFQVPELLEEFKGRPEVAPYIEGGEVVEYSAHLIPEGGARPLKRPFGDGILVVGDAAGFALNMGITVRGMEFALVSGVLAARTVLKAKERGDFSSATLSHYQELLSKSFIAKDMRTFEGTLEALENPRLYDHYPGFLCSLLERLFYIGEGPKERLSTTLFQAMMDVALSPGGWKDLWDLRRL
ncbi:MAG: electron transfer flavoprotein [Deltaproteobacteria bacterium]|nr:MAG: electron transfer flavoprotein [Deltaproteobacteria bacterium]